MSREVCKCAIDKYISYNHKETQQEFVNVQHRQLIDTNIFMSNDIRFRYTVSLILLKIVYHFDLYIYRHDR